MKNQYEIRGETTAILLKRRNGEILEAFISTSDLQRVKEFSNTWCVAWDSHVKSYYVMGKKDNSDGTKSTIKLHRFILDAPKGMLVDHIDHNTLNNSRENLRIVTRSENGQNRIGAQLNSKSGVRGVFWDKERQKWRAVMKLNGKQTILGRFNTIQEAEKASIEARKKHMLCFKEH